MSFRFAIVGVAAAVAGCQSPKVEEDSIPGTYDSNGCGQIRIDGEFIKFPEGEVKFELHEIKSALYLKTDRIVRFRYSNSGCLLHMTQGTEYVPLNIHPSKIELSILSDDRSRSIVFSREY